MYFFKVLNEINIINERTTKGNIQNRSKMSESCEVFEVTVENRDSGRSGSEGVEVGSV